MRINKEFSTEDVRYLHVSNEPSMIGLKMRQDMVVVAALRKAKRQQRTRDETSLVSAPARRDNLSCMKCRLAVLARLFLSTPSLTLSYAILLSLILFVVPSRALFIFRASAKPVLTANRSTPFYPVPLKFRKFLRIKGMRNAIREKFRSQIERW